MDRLSDAEGGAFFQVPAGYALPARDDLIQDVRAIVQTNVVLARELSATGLGASPIWEAHGGGTAVRATVLPAAFASRYSTGGGLHVLSTASVPRMVAEVIPWLFDDLAGAAMALEDTHRVYYSAEAPLRPLNMPFKGHFKLLTLLLADIARKGDAGLDTLEWFGSLGLPLDEFRNPGDPPVAEIRAEMNRHMQAMWKEEETWLAAALRA